MAISTLRHGLMYHYLNAEFGLQDIERRRLKLSHVDRLNDPFEHRAIELSDESQRRALHSAIAESAKAHGIVCFSKSYCSPVMWSHYADRHKGLCLGFEVRDIPLTEIKYIPKRLRGKITSAQRSPLCEQRLMLEIIRSKHIEWQYEKEVRLTMKLDAATVENGLHFLPFSKNLILRRVIVGVESKVTRANIGDALGPNKIGVETFKVRPAFRSFQMVRNKCERLWI